MLPNITKYALLLSVLLALVACQGQNKLEKGNSQNVAIAKGTIVTELPAQVWSVHQDQKGNYWFGSNGQGVVVYDGKEMRRFTYEDGLVDDDIRGIQSDKQGRVYVQTPEGVSQFDGERFTTLPIDQSAPDNWQLHPDDLWFNCNGNPQEVYRFDGDTLFELSLPRQNLIQSFGAATIGESKPYTVFGIDKDKDGNLWLGTVVAGAFRYDGESFLWFPEKELSTLPGGRVPGVRSMIADKDGYFWLSNFLSKYHIHDEKDSLYYEKLAGIDLSKNELEDLPYFNSAVMDNDENLWMTTYGSGVWKYDGENLTNYTVRDGAEDALIISIYLDQAGILWLGTNNVGVFKQNGDTFERFVFEDL